MPNILGGGCKNCKNMVKCVRDIQDQISSNNASVHAEIFLKALDLVMTSLNICILAYIWRSLCSIVATQDFLMSFKCCFDESI